ncbi:hypothetical protein BDV40DRAFT_295228 [Aspergillus tamarii]|uniref:Rhodopsin domain-containing protein n=1 Tax=Aspergillus tamarii TaxID=41984 RepID=A0A5N6V9N2_ASPTM|nr:hypothetical protein BDV40DRAFT_295228 [Aspergillus tamarii]
MGRNARAETHVHICTALIVLSTFIVAIRIVARWKKSILGWDDYAISLSLAIAYSMLGEAIIWARDGGLGKHTDDLNREEKIVFTKCFVANEISYILLVSTIKISTLTFYSRIFTIPKFKVTSTIITGLALLWCLAILITVILQCRLVSFNWDESQNNLYINIKVFLFSVGIANLLFDIIVVALPILPILKLHLDLSQKLSLLGIFLLAGLVCIASIMRIITLNSIQEQDASYSAMDAATWTFVEPSIGIICSCLPTLRSLLRAFRCSFARDTTDPSREPTRQAHRMRRIPKSGKDAVPAFGGKPSSHECLRDDPQLVELNGSLGVTLRDEEKDTCSTTITTEFSIV